MAFEHRPVRPGRELLRYWKLCMAPRTHLVITDLRLSMWGLLAYGGQAVDLKLIAKHKDLKRFLT